MDLYYVIHTEPKMIPVVYITEDDKIIYHVLHNNHDLRLHTLSIHFIIDQLTTGTDYDEWINSFRCNRNVSSTFNAIFEEYDRSA